MRYVSVLDISSDGKIKKNDVIARKLKEWDTIIVSRDLRYRYFRRRHTSPHNSNQSERSRARVISQARKSLGELWHVQLMADGIAIRNKK